MTLDIPTMYMLSVITNVAMTMAVVLVALRQSIPGLAQMAWALVASSSFYLVLGAKGMVPDLVAIGLGNTLGALSESLMLLAVLRSRRKRLPAALYVAPVLAMFLASVIFLDDRETRLVLASFVLVYQLSLLLWNLPRAGFMIRGRGCTIMAVAAAVGLAAMGYRGLSLGLGWHELAAFQSRDTLNTLFYLVNYLGMLFLVFGFVLHTAEQSAERNLRLSLEDPLTGLANRRALFQRMDAAFERGRQMQLPLSLMVIDVDHFKKVNDRFGHQVGDAVLQHVAAMIEQRFRSEDITGRLGGEEFLVVLPDTSLEDATAVAEELRKGLAVQPKVVDEKAIQVTISIGVSGVEGLSELDTPDSLIAAADEAVYLAKSNGRNRVESVTSLLNPAA